MLNTPTLEADSKRKRLPAEERKREIVSAVVELAGRNGPDAITTQAIADKVGITQGALFRHFADKQAIWIHVFDWVSEQLDQVVGNAFAAGGDPLIVLERVFISHVDFVSRHPGVPRILFHELQRPADSLFHRSVRTMIGNYRQRIHDVLRQAKTSGHLPRTLNEEGATVLFIGTIQGLVMQSALFRNETEMLATARRLFPLILFGLKGTPQ